MGSTLRQKFARCLRKWADLIDPKKAPSTHSMEMVVAVSCDSTEFTREMARMEKQLRELLALSDQIVGASD